MNGVPHAREVRAKGSCMGGLLAVVVEAVAGMIGAGIAVRASPVGGLPLAPRLVAGALGGAIVGSLLGALVGGPPAGDAAAAAAAGGFDATAAILQLAGGAAGGAGLAAIVGQFVHGE
jgi:hypothetical protein